MALFNLKCEVGRALFAVIDARFAESPSWAVRVVAQTEAELAREAISTDQRE
jgi:hypothetical protein